MAIGIGVISWFAEAVAFVAILAGLGVPLSGALVPQATGAMAIGTLIGAVSFLPGGLGFAEGGIVGLLLLLVPDISLAQAAAATLLFRLVTFWFGVSLGMVTLTWLLGRIGRA
jgi:glycosyltransferase 2 family protein